MPYFTGFPRLLCRGALREFDRDQGASGRHFHPLISAWPLDGFHGTLQGGISIPLETAKNQTGTAAGSLSEVPRKCGESSASRKPLSPHFVDPVPHCPSGPHATLNTPLFPKNVTAWRACYGAMLRRGGRQSSMNTGIVTLLRRADPRGGVPGQSPQACSPSPDILRQASRSH
jgi:hypothetical protein